MGSWWAYYLLGRYPESLATLQSALADAESIKELPLAAMCHDYLGRTYAAMNDRDTALRHFQNALLIFLRVGARMEAARTRLWIGQVYQQQGKIGKRPGNAITKHSKPFARSLIGSTSRRRPLTPWAVWH